MISRFTVDGSDALERQLAEICDQVRLGIEKIVPGDKLDALVLGGGYGRGEGGVLRTELGEAPYNDIEFYLLIRGARLLNERRYRKGVHALSDELSIKFGLHVEFKIDSIDRLRQMPTTMFTYDLVSAHRLIIGQEGGFKNCEHHARAEDIPLSEATRLLYNRCSGLLLVRELLTRGDLSADDNDFIGRNLAKASLALGDALLVAAGQYHWSARARAGRLESLRPEPGGPDLEVIRQHHDIGLQFKLHPRRLQKSQQQFASEHRELSTLAKSLWLWLESRRLNHPFTTIQDYVFNRLNKCPETSSSKNYLLTARTFGPGAVTSSLAGRYPRERLFNSLPLLLWNGEVSREPEVQRHLQQQLESDASDWAGLVQAYKKIWPAYG